jgi:hypothetical protein
VPSWDQVAVGEAGSFRLAVICLRDEPSQWGMLIDTPLMNLCLDMPDHTAAHQALRFFQRTRGKNLPVRVDMTFGTFDGRSVRLTKNDEDQRYFVELLPHEDDRASNGYLFLRLEEGSVGDVVSALRQVVKELDAKGGNP